MFNYDITYGLKKDSGIVDIKSDKNILLLIPEMIDDIIAKINSLTVEVSPNEFGISSACNFKNGYACLGKVNGRQRILTKNGEIFEIDKEGLELESSFYEDMAAASYYDYDSNDDSYGYINGITHEFVPLPKELKVKWADDFLDGYAKIRTTNVGTVFVDKDMNVLALDKVEEIKNIRCLSYRDKARRAQELSENLGASTATIFFRIDKLDNIKKIESGETNRYIYIDNENGMNIMAHQIVRKLASCFGLELPDISLKEQLVWLIGEISRKGIYLLYLDSESESPKVEIIDEENLLSGVRISDGVNSVASFVEKDVSFMRERIKNK